MPGSNGGWPLDTNGLVDSGEPLTIGKDLGLDLPIAKTIPPTVDFTPALSLSGFTFHNGHQFPAWNRDLLVASRRASTMFRIRVRDSQLLEIAKLVEHLGRVCDVEMGSEGIVYLLVEKQHGGRLHRIKPAARR